MLKNRLHIVAFDIPYPPDYGGAIDVFYKIKSLADAGAEIYLHCYEYGRQHAPELEQYCKQVWYYPRTVGIKGMSFTLPYIVNSRKHPDLLLHLQQVEAPILFEGIHTTNFLSHSTLKNRFKAIRAHNIEHQYYLQLSLKQNSFLKKLYYSIEAALLKKYEQTLHDAQAFFPLSMEDKKYLQQVYPRAQHAFIAPFHPNNEMNIIAGSGDYCLYHGNLSHPENIEAVLFLLKEVIPFSGMPFIIAGKKPGAELQSAIQLRPECTLIADPTTEQLDELISAAHIHVLPCFQRTGVKLKLLYALFRGRHVLVNDEILHGTGLESICVRANSAKTFIDKISELKNVPFSQEDIFLRKAALKEHYDNLLNAKRILSLIPLPQNS